MRVEEEADVSPGIALQDGKGSTIRTEYTVRLDFGDFKHATGDKAAKEAFSIGLVAIHEFDHRIYSVSDDPNSATAPGPVENNYINPIRRELGLAERVNYVSGPVPAAVKSFFPSGGQQLNFKLNGKDKVLRWRNDLVGGVVK